MDKIEVQVTAMREDDLGAPIPRDVKSKEFDAIKKAEAYAKSDKVDKGESAIILVIENGVARQI